MAKQSVSIQDSFLDRLIVDKIPTTVFLVNGVKLQGVLVGFDEAVLMLRRDAHSQLVYKHAVSTVLPSTPVLLAGEVPSVADA